MFLNTYIQLSHHAAEHSKNLIVLHQHSFHSASKLLYNGYMQSFWLLLMQGKNSNSKTKTQQQWKIVVSHDRQFDIEENI